MRGLKEGGIAKGTQGVEDSAQQIAEFKPTFSLSNIASTLNSHNE